MNEYLSIYWWLGIIGALLLGMASNYLTRGFGRALSYASTSWKERVANKRKEHEANVRMHLSDQTLLVLTAVKATRAQIMTMVYLVIGLTSSGMLQRLGEIKARGEDFLAGAMALVIGAALLALLALSAAFLVAAESFEAGRLAKLLKDVEQRRKVERIKGP